MKKRCKGGLDSSFPAFPFLGGINGDLPVPDDHEENVDDIDEDDDTNDFTSNGDPLNDPEDTL